MLRHRAAILAVLTLATSGCGLHPRARMVSGVVVGAVGAGVVAQVEPCQDDFLGLCSAANGSALMLGGVLIAAGIATFLSGVAADAEQPSPPAALPVAAVPVASTPAPAPAPVPASPTADGAQRAIVSRIENRLAIQASLAASAGHCDSAMITANELAKLDPELYARLLAADTQLARCHGL